MHVLLFLGGFIFIVTGFAALGFGVNEHRLSGNSPFIVPGAIGAIGGLVLLGLGGIVTRLARITEILETQPLPRTLAAVPEIAANDVLPLPLTEKAIAPPKAKTEEPLEAEVTSPTETKAPAPEPEPMPREAPPVIVEPPPPVQAPTVAPPPSPPASGNGAESEGVAKADTAPPVVAVAPMTPAPAPPKVAPPVIATPAAPPATPPRVAPEPVVPTPRPPDGSRNAAPEVRITPINGDGAPPRVLKSGVIEGMAYTLYSDGAVDAELPQHGTMRFTSIAEWRAYMRGEQ